MMFFNLKKDFAKDGGLSARGQTKLAIFIILLVIMVAVCLLIAYDFDNTAKEYVEASNQQDDYLFDSKAKFRKQYEAKVEQAVADSKEQDGNTSTGAQFTTKGDGKLITDTTKNPVGIPLYDGYTMDGGYFDIDYTRFHDMSYPNEYLRGVGDFTNAEAKNSVSYEFAKDNVGNGEGTKWLKTNPTAKEMGGYWTADGRLCVALPAGAITRPEIHEPLIDTWWRNTAKYTNQDKGTICLWYIPNAFDDSLNGQYVDCVLSDGTVLAMVVTDTKGAHTGVYRGSDLCQDNLVDGYCQRRCYTNGTLSYNGIIEIGCTLARKAAWDPKTHLNLAGNKIMGFRVYTDVKHFDVSQPGVYNTYFTGGQSN
ncbi:MAG: hypothetical protein K1W15_10025 [Lachnospiraceae bacterium]